MKVLIDTSSLLSMVRYYLPFDASGKLFDFLKTKVESGEILVLDKVFVESSRTAKGIVLDKFEFLKKKENQINSTEILPSRKFFNQVENQFARGISKRVLTAEEFEKIKSEFIESADAKMVLYCLTRPGEKVCIVTEETETPNDGKPFKKLPAICKLAKIDYKTLPDFLQECGELNISIV